MKILAYARSYVQWILFGLTLLFYVMIIFVCSFFLKPHQFEPILQSLAAQMVRISGIDLHVHGKENVDRKKSYVVMFNHFNFLDHFVIFHVLKLRLRGLEKEAHFHWPVYGTLMKQIGIIPIPPRGNTEKAIEALAIAKSRIQEGISMLIAPEGTRTITGELGKFKKGGFHLAIQTQADILPVVFMGMYEFNHKKTRLLSPGRVDLFIEPPVSTKDLTESDVTELRNTVRKIYDKFYDED